MFKVNMISIIKVISAIFCFSLAMLAFCLVVTSPASPIPALIVFFILCINDTVISHILIKKGKENSPYFDQEHHWKYEELIYAIECLIVIIMYRYLL